MNDYEYIRSELENAQSGYVSINKWDEQMSALAGNGGVNADGTKGQLSNLTSKFTPKYADEILPFDITITMANEYGQNAVLVIYGVELLNEGSGYSIDSVTTEKAYTFVARRMDYLQALSDDNEVGFSSTW